MGEQVEQQVFKLREYLMGQMPVVVSFCIRVVLAIVVFFIGKKLIAWVLKMIRRSMGRFNVDTGAVQFTCSLVKVILYAVLIFNIGIQFGITESSVAALLGTAGITVGLAVQGGLANLAGGMMLLIFKPFQVGDYIVLDAANGVEGTVAKVEMCYTTLKSVDNKNVVIPNGTLSNSMITNVTASSQRKLEVKVSISYDSDLKKARGILEKLLHEDPDTKSDKDMVVFVDELGESAVIMGFRVWVPTDCYWPVKWRLNERIKEEFDAQGIVLAYNQLDVHVHNLDFHGGCPL